MSFIKASGLGPLTASNTATIVDPQTPAGGSAIMSPLVSFASQATTSGTSFDFIGIPSWTKRITFMFNGVSTNNVSNYLIQLGSGSITSSGYTSVSAYCGLGNSAGYASYTAGFGIYVGAANNVLHGHMLITFFGSNTWVASSVFTTTPGYSFQSCGSVTLSGTLDRVRLTTVNGTDAFDAGSVNVMYE